VMESACCGGSRGPRFHRKGIRGRQLSHMYATTWRDVSWCEPKQFRRRVRDRQPVWRLCLIRPLHAIADGSLGDALPSAVAGSLPIARMVAPKALYGAGYTVLPPDNHRSRAKAKPESPAFLSFSMRWRYSFDAGAEAGSSGAG